MIKILYSKTEEETETLGKNLAKTLKVGDIILLTGPLGSGKTCFTRGIASFFKIIQVHSPTFAIINQYKNEKYQLLHLDLYRIQDMHHLDLDFYFNKKNQIIIIEWGEKIESLLPKKPIKISLEIEKNNRRKITVTTP